jgi:putative lipoprotein
MSRVMLDDPGEQFEGPTRVYHAVVEGNDLRVEIVDEPCTDSMKGDSFPSQVLVHHNGRTYWGCGRALEHPWE